MFGSLRPQGVSADVEVVSAEGRVCLIKRAMAVPPSQSSPKAVPVVVAG
jgi:hypothetical protein